MLAAQGDYYEARRDAERLFSLGKYIEHTGDDDALPSLEDYTVPLRDQPEDVQRKWYPSKPLILRLDDVVVVAMTGALIGAGWLGLQLLGILFFYTLRMGAKSIAQGKAEAAERKSAT